MSLHVKFGREEDEALRDIVVVFSEVILVVKVFDDCSEVHVGTEAARKLIESIRDDLRNSIASPDANDEHRGPDYYRMASSDPRWRRGD